MSRVVARRGTAGAAGRAALAAALALACGRVGAAEPVFLKGAEDVARLCRALQPAGRAGSEARARAEALERRYRVTVSGDGLDFEPWDETAGLRLSPRAVLLGAGRSLRLWMPDGDDLAVKAPRAAAQRIFQAKGRGRLALGVTFEIPAGEAGERPCTQAPTGKSWILAVEPVSWEYLSGAEVLARGGEAGAGSAAEGSQPRVTVGEAVGAAATSAVRAALQAAVPDLTACYREALARSPSLDGTLVVELSLSGKAGPPRSARIAADSVQDEALAACVQGVAEKARFPAGKAGLASMAVQLELAAPAPR
ncbi:MAG TPA: AgmX/PglI C-terminal domain-containing protein [Anaeromyxobacteraceae bacterium]|nr:AgmX/PglI C-terminal domain-containing protein [Anaeromyxobacteraceae bacterium]